MNAKALIYTFLLAGLVQLINPVEPAASIISVPLSKKISQALDNPKQPEITHYVNVEIGIPGQEFKVKLDLKFNDLFVPHYEWNKLMPYLHYKSGYLCSKSSTCDKISRGYAIIYEGARLEGNQYRDWLSLPRSDNRVITFPQIFLAVKETKERDFSNDIVDGYFGLGPIQVGLNRRGIIKSLLDAKHIDLMQFSMWFDMSYATRFGGELILGGVDESRYTGSFSWHRIATNDVWALKLESVYLGASQVSAQAGRAILSSSASGVYGPQQIVGKIYELFAAKVKDGIGHVDCKNAELGPSLTFIMDNIRYALPPSNFVIKSPGGLCYLNIYPTKVSSYDWILGTSFLSAYYTVFDSAHGQVGFASVKLN